MARKHYLSATSVAAVAVAAIAALAGSFTGARPAAAQGPEYPLFDATANVGVVEVNSNATGTQLVVTLENARPNTTYTVSDCQVNGDGTTACMASATDDTITTDQNGNAVKTVEVAGATHTDVVMVSDTADATDIAVAAVTPGTVAPGGPMAIPSSLPN